MPTPPPGPHTFHRRDAVVYYLVLRIWEKMRRWMWYLSNINTLKLNTSSPVSWRAFGHWGLLIHKILKLTGLFHAPFFSPFQFFFTCFRRKPNRSFYLAENGDCFSLAAGHTHPMSHGLPSFPSRNVLPAFNTYTFFSSCIRAKHCAEMWNLSFSGRNNEFLCMLSTWKK